MYCVEEITKKALSDGKKIYLRGVNNYAVSLGIYFDRCGINFSGYHDINPDLQGKCLFNGHICYSPDINDCNCLIICTLIQKKNIDAVKNEYAAKQIDCYIPYAGELYDICKEIDDETFLRYRFRQMMGYELDLDDPKTFNEKMQWLKLYDRRPEYIKMVDKYEVKKFVADKIGEQYIIPTLGIWDHFDDIDFDSLPEQFVLKCTHDSGSIIVCKNKSMFDRKAAKERLEKCLKINYFYSCREWPYKNVKPQIIAEKYMKDKKSEILNVYKVFNFGGAPYLIQSIINDKTPDETIDYYDVEWNKLNFRQNYPNGKIPQKKPNRLSEMLRLAKILSRGFPFIRTDFYLINDSIFFSEFTFYSDAGFANFEPPEWDIKLGDLIKLPI